MTVRWSSLKRLAALGLAAQFLALTRTLGEVFRLKYFVPDRYTLAAIEPFVGAALLTAVLAAVTVSVFAIGRYRTALTIALVNILALLVYRVAFM